jgi:hypothetical protein
MRDTAGGTTANFLHTTAHRDKSGSGTKGKRDCADKALDRLSIETRKPLNPGDLSGQAASLRNMLMDVNKRAKNRGQHCMSPIHGH